MVDAGRRQRSHSVVVAGRNRELAAVGVVEQRDDQLSQGSRVGQGELIEVKDERLGSEQRCRERLEERLEHGGVGRAGQRDDDRAVGALDLDRQAHSLHLRRQLMG